MILLGLGGEASVKFGRRALGWSERTYSNAWEVSEWRLRAAIGGFMK